MITPEKIREVCERFRKSTFYEDSIVDMKTAYARFEAYQCTACHAGHYMVANIHRIPIDKARFPSWIHGAGLMGRDLGFGEDMETAKIELQFWAEANPEIWGNKNGISIFSSAMAFGVKTKHGVMMSLDDIVAHWEGVADRLEKEND